MERVLTTATTVLHEFKSHLGEFLLVLLGIVRNLFALGTLELYDIVLGHREFKI